MGQLLLDIVCLTITWGRELEGGGERVVSGRGRRSEVFSLLRHQSERPHRDVTLNMYLHDHRPAAHMQSPQDEQPA